VFSALSIALTGVASIARERQSPDVRTVDIVLEFWSLPCSVSRQERRQARAAEPTKCRHRPTRRGFHLRPFACVISSYRAWTPRAEPRRVPVHAACVGVAQTGCAPFTKGL